MTLAAAFKKVYGERLAAHGFKKIKSKYPYYVRLVNEEILHVITYSKESPSGSGKGAFSVFWGIATIYRKEITFDKNVGFNKCWLENINLIKSRAEKKGFEYAYEYKENNDMDLIESICESYNVVEKYVLPKLDCANTLANSFQTIVKCKPYNINLELNDNYINDLKMYEYNEGLVSLLIFGVDGYEQYVEIREKAWIDFYIGIRNKVKEGLYRYTDEDLSNMERDEEAFRKNQYRIFKEFTTDPVWKEKIENALMIRKNHNNYILEKWGIKKNESTN